MMKNLKNIVTGVSLVLMMFMSVNLRAQELSELSNDETFVSYVKDQFEFNKEANVALVNELASVEEIGEEHFELVYKAFNTSEESYSKFVELQNDRMLVLNEKYNLESVSIDELKPIVGLVFDQMSANQTESEPCEDRYNNTLINIAASAVIAHAGCVAADVTVVIGIICHSAVTAWWVTENNAATYAYQDCLNK